jgi:hypothetical protein
MNPSNSVWAKICVPLNQIVCLLDSSLSNHSGKGVRHLITLLAKTWLWLVGE